MSAATDGPPPAAADARANEVTEQAGAGRPGLFGRLLRAGATSMMATILSHGTYIALLAAAHADATVASAIAFAIGASFNYFVGRRLTWGRTNRPHPVKEMLPYVIVIAAGGLVSVGVATLVQHIITPMGLTNTERTIVLEIANIVSYGAVFFFKFLLLDKLVFRHR
ncbi:GtrA family protein [Microlunatus soli]|uniref:GtrA family protein n=1 Tax=Microlunatus soli TaxID=630515 RepID=UPI0012F928CD|nr:GtrA family protein [Microlunatus soli]